jgi:hypothetical protein
LLAVTAASVVGQALMPTPAAAYITEWERCTFHEYCGGEVDPGDIPGGGIGGSSGGGGGAGGFPSGGADVAPHCVLYGTCPSSQGQSGIDYDTDYDDYCRLYGGCDQGTLPDPCAEPGMSCWNQYLNPDPRLPRFHIPAACQREYEALLDYLSRDVPRSVLSAVSDMFIYCVKGLTIPIDRAAPPAASLEQGASTGPSKAFRANARHKKRSRKHRASFQRP